MFKKENLFSIHFSLDGIAQKTCVRKRIDSQRMLLHIEQGKGQKDRYAMLSPRLLFDLRFQAGTGLHGLRALSH